MFYPSKNPSERQLNMKEKDEDYFLWLKCVIHVFTSCHSRHVFQSKSQLLMRKLQALNLLSEVCSNQVFKTEEDKWENTVSFKTSVLKKQLKDDNKWMWPEQTSGVKIKPEEEEEEEQEVTPHQLFIFYNVNLFILGIV